MSDETALYHKNEPCPSISHTISVFLFRNGAYVRMRYHRGTRTKKGRGRGKDFSAAATCASSVSISAPSSMPPSSMRLTVRARPLLTPSLLSTARSTARPVRPCAWCVALLDLPVLLDLPARPREIFFRAGVFLPRPATIGRGVLCMPFVSICPVVSRCVLMLFHPSVSEKQKVRLTLDFIG